MEKLRQKAEELHITLNADQTSRFNLYYEMMVETNRVMNLTAITEYEQVVDKHFIDSLLLSQVVDLEQPLTCIDVGTGAGFPGIPLKIAYPKLNMVLLDSLNKRVGFLNQVIQALMLTDIQAIHSRAEDAAKNNAHREKYDLCVSRAVANLATLAEYCLPFVRVGGTFVAYKAGEIDAELEASAGAVRTLGGEVVDVWEGTLPGTDLSRTLIQIKKIGHTPKQYPRKAGTASKDPIK